MSRKEPDNVVYLQCWLLCQKYRSCKWTVVNKYPADHIRSFTLVCPECTQGQFSSNQTSPRRAGVGGKTSPIKTEDFKGLWNPLHRNKAPWKFTHINLHLASTPACKGRGGGRLHAGVGVFYFKKVGFHFVCSSPGNEEQKKSLRTGKAEKHHLVPQLLNRCW